MNGVDCEKTLEIINKDIVQGKDCYLAEVMIEPPIIPNAIAKIDMETMDTIQIQSSGMLQGMPFSSKTDFSYKYSQPSFPIVIGNSWETTTTEDNITTMLGETDSYTTTKKGVYKVEGFEQITVPAGDFTCYKIVKYNEDNEKLKTKWYSDEVKSNVKVIDYLKNEVAELISYSVSVSY